MTDVEWLASHWAIQALGPTTFARAITAANEQYVIAALGPSIVTGSTDEIAIASPPGQLTLPLRDAPVSRDVDFAIGRSAVAAELAATERLQAIIFRATTPDSNVSEARAAASAAFDLLRGSLDAPYVSENVLKVSAMGYVADRWTDVRRMLSEKAFHLALPEDKAPWDDRVARVLMNAWLRLFRKDGWEDVHHIAGAISQLRLEQREYESTVLAGGASRKKAARLLVMYNWARATELLAGYLITGRPRDIWVQVSRHFESAEDAARFAEGPAYQNVIRWLHAASETMVTNSLWSVAGRFAADNEAFIGHLVTSRSMFEMLPPQRQAIAEQGLLDLASRAIVVSLPTSAGKTTLAEFRIVQTLALLRDTNAWVAYVAPTRALVGQIARRLRADLSPLGIEVAELSAAVDLDPLEEDLFDDQGNDAFHVLVSTPEKLSLAIRSRPRSRPLALVVLDEAQLLEDHDRGLRIELLLAIAKNDEPDAHLLLLTPSVPNGHDLARWLGDDSGKSISLSVSWHPNDQVIGTFRTDRLGHGEWQLIFDPVVTPRTERGLNRSVRIGSSRPIDCAWATASRSKSIQTAGIAHVFSERGTALAIGRRVADVWSMASAVAESSSGFTPSDEVRLVQRYLQSEVGSDYALVGLLDKGVAVHHAAMSDEARTLVEWLTETGRIRVLCATTTLVHGINFPVSSVFLASPHETSFGSPRLASRTLWNLIGRAGRVGQDSVGVFGIAADEDRAAVAEYLRQEVGTLASRLEQLVGEAATGNHLGDLVNVLDEEQWADFRSYVAHLQNVARSTGTGVAAAEDVLRNTWGYASLRASESRDKQDQAQALLVATREYAQGLSREPHLATLADATGFSPEGVRQAMGALGGVDGLTADSWLPERLFATQHSSSLRELMGVLLRLPEVRGELAEIAGEGIAQSRIADICAAWVSGASIGSIAATYFSESREGSDTTDSISQACRAIYRSLAYAATWGLSGLSKLPTARIDYANLDAAAARRIRLIPAMVYHGVNTEEAIVMRMAHAPRSLAQTLGARFVASANLSNSVVNVHQARSFLRTMRPEEWQDILPAGSPLTGRDLHRVWRQLSGEVDPMSRDDSAAGQGIAASG